MQRPNPTCAAIPLASCVLALSASGVMEWTQAILQVQRLPLACSPPLPARVCHRDGMKRNDWLALVAIHSDSWLMSVAVYNAARIDQEGRRQLFNDINTLPTCYEVVSGRAANAPVPGAAHLAKRASGGGGGDVGREPSSKRVRGGAREDENYEEDEEEDDFAAEADNCPNCGRMYK
jgi:hypothetical protein